MAKQISLEFGSVETRPVETKKLNVFARHETFHPRFGWLKKGFDRATADTEIFLRPDAPVRLGVGKNMVRSIRYWCTAFKVLDEQATATAFGTRLLDDQGWDPFLEDPASLWLLHWQLLTPPCWASAWDYAFNQFRLSEFSAEDLFLGLWDMLESQSVRVAESSLRKDITCILRMYAEPDGKTGFNEDLVDCPFTALRLLYPAGDSKQYEFQVGPKDNLPAEIVGYACLEFASRVGSGQRTVSLSRLAFDPGSPGLVFKLSESAIADAIEQVARRSEAIFLSDTAGLIQLSYTDDPMTLAVDLLNDYYRRRTDRSDRHRRRRSL